MSRPGDASAASRAAHRQIGFLVPLKGRPRLGPIGPVEPVAGGARIFECGEVRVDDTIPCARSEAREGCLGAGTRADDLR
jgi:hypothetical protein